MIMFLKFWLITLGIMKGTELAVDAFIWIKRKIKGGSK